MLKVDVSVLIWHLCCPLKVNADILQSSLFNCSSAVTCLRQVTCLLCRPLLVCVQELLFRETCVVWAFSCWAIWPLLHGHRNLLVCSIVLIVSFCWPLRIQFAFHLEVETLLVHSRKGVLALSSFWLFVPALLIGSIYKKTGSERDSFKSTCKLPGHPLFITLHYWAWCVSQASFLSQWQKHLNGSGQSVLIMCSKNIHRRHSESSLLKFFPIP